MLRKHQTGTIINQISGVFGVWPGGGRGAKVPNGWGPGGGLTAPGEGPRVKPRWRFLGAKRSGR